MKIETFYLEVQAFQVSFDELVESAYADLVEWLKERGAVIQFFHKYGVRHVQSEKIYLSIKNQPTIELIDNEYIVYEDGEFIQLTVNELYRRYIEKSDLINV
jgi:hypothetical protein